MKKIKKQPITKKHLIPLMFLCLTLIFFASTASAASNVIYVNNETGNDNYDGQSDVYNITTGSGPKLTIKNATQTVTAGGTVNIADGLYTGANNRDMTIDKDMTINGQSTAGTIIDAEQNGRIFNILAGITVTIQNLTLTNGQSSESGGATLYNQGTLTVNNVTFKDNHATEYSSGGAICNSGDLTVTGSTFTGNKAACGGAIINAGTLTVTDSDFTGNNAIYSTGAYYGGGAISNYGGTLIVRDSTFTENTVDYGYGGAISNHGTLTVTGSTFTENTVDDGNGGAISNHGTLTVTGSKFTENKANDGGAIFNWGAAYITSSILNGNNAMYGGAIYNRVQSNLEGYLTITGCNIHSNTATQGGAFYNWGPFAANYTRIVGNIATDSSDPSDAIHNAWSGVINGEYNWWGSNNDPKTVNHLINSEGSINVDPWLMLNITANPDSINTGKTSNITADVYTDSKGDDHSEDWDQFFSGAEVTFTTDLGNVGSKSITVDWNHGWASTTLTADEGPGVATVTAADGTEVVSTTVTIISDEHKEPTTTTVSDVSGYAGQSVDLVANVTAENNAIVNGGTVNFTVNGISAGSATVNNGQASTSWTIPATWTGGTYPIVAEYLGTDDYDASQGQNTLTVIPSTSLYLKVTSSNDSPRVGEKFTLTYKLGNKGPDPAKNVTITFQVPKGLEFINIKVDNGTYTYDPETRTVTWTLKEVPLGDPYLYLTVSALESGEVVINNTIISETYNKNSSSSIININILPASNGGKGSSNTASAATVPMQDTGTPLNYLVLAILMVITGLITPKRR